MKNIQMFIHKYYDVIKLVLSVLNIGLVMFLILYAQSLQAQSAKTRGELIVEITQSIQRETKEQTKIINRQFKALCLLIVEQGGQTALDKLDTDTRRRCETLAIATAKEQSVVHDVSPYSAPMPTIKSYTPPAVTEPPTSYTPPKEDTKKTEQSPVPKSPLLYIPILSPIINSII